MMLDRPKYFTRKPLKRTGRKAVPGFMHQRRCHIPAARIAFGHNPLWLIRLMQGKDINLRHLM